MSDERPWDRPNHPAVERRAGRSRLVYDKATRTIKPERASADDDERAGALYEAMREIANLPEQGGCGDGIDAVDLWMLMQKKARAAVDAYEQAGTKQDSGTGAK